MNAGFGLDQLTGDPHTPPRLTYTAFQYIPHAEFTAHAAHAHRLTFVSEARIARDDEQALDTRKASDDVLDNSVGKIFLLQVTAQPMPECFFLRPSLS